MVERVSHVLPQLQVTVMVLYTGWILGFIRGRIIHNLAAESKLRGLRDERFPRQRKSGRWPGAQFSISEQQRRISRLPVSGSTSVKCDTPPNAWSDTKVISP